MILYREIEKLALASFGEEVTRDNYERWVAHWFLSAAEFRDSANNAGLTETALATQKIIDEQSAIYERRL